MEEKSALHSKSYLHGSGTFSSVYSESIPLTFGSAERMVGRVEVGRKGYSSGEAQRQKLFCFSTLILQKINSFPSIPPPSGKKYFF